MTKETEEFVSLLTPENAVVLADYIVSVFGKKGEEPNPVKLLDYDFHVSRGVMLGTVSKKANTGFSFDFPVGHFGKRIIELLGDTQVDAESTRETFLTFLDRVAVVLNSHPGLAEKLTESVLGKGSPLIKHLDVKTITLSDLPTIDWTVTVHKLAAKGSVSVPVGADIMNEYLLTGEDPLDIVKRKQEAGDSRYEFVTGVTKTKNFFECDVILWADYSADTSNSDNHFA